MSPQLIAHNNDLKRLRDEGFAITIRNGYLVIDKVPYVRSDRTVSHAALATKLNLQADATQRPSTHVALWTGEYPCSANGSPLDKIRHTTSVEKIDDSLLAQHQFSSKPPNGYSDYHELMVAYAQVIAHEARAIDPTASPHGHVAVESQDNSPFQYVDTATSRAGIVGVAARLVSERIAIIGVGGTGSYILDLVAKTQVAEVHLFDADEFRQHNAFRCPGAISVDELKQRKSKVDLMAQRYGVLRRNIVPHKLFIDAANVSELAVATFAFVCLDKGSAKRAIFQYLASRNVPFIDVGMGVTQVDDALAAILRVTASSTTNRDHLAQRVSFGDSDDDAYAQNIQIGDLNMLNAALAVIKWKKIRGFYVDLEREQNCLYTLDGNHLLNQDVACPN